MFNWLARLFSKLFEKRRQRELYEFMLPMKEMDSTALGMLAFCVAAVQSEFENHADEYGLPRMASLSQPVEYIKECPDCFLVINKQIKNAQKTNELLVATGCLVWLHTLRATVHPELQPAVQEMWKDISRGFPFLPDSQSMMAEQPSLAGNYFVIRGYYGVIPDGFEETIEPDFDNL